MAEKATALAEAKLMTLSQVAHEWGIGRDKTRRLMQNVKPAGDKNGYPAYAISDAARVMVVDELGLDIDGEKDPEAMAPKDRKDWYDGELRRLQLLIEKGELVPSTDVRDRLSEVFKTIKAFLQTLADVLERDVGLPPIAAAKVVNLCDKLCDNLTDKLVE